MYRPTAITVFAVLNFVFAAGKSLQLLWTMFWMVLMTSDLVHDLPFGQMQAQLGVAKGWTWIGIPLSAVAIAGLVVSGVGLLRMRPWARKVALAYAGYAILLVLGRTAYSVLVLFPRMAEVMGPQMQGGPEMGAMMGASAVMGAAIGLIYPSLLLVFMTRKDIVEALDAPFGEPPTPHSPVGQS